MTRCATCQHSYAGLRVEHCRACCRSFTNTKAGDLHRTGRHGVSSGPSRRRCRDAAEMLAVGLVLNARGYWTRDQGQAQARPPQELRAGTASGASASAASVAPTVMAASKAVSEVAA